MQDLISRQMLLEYIHGEPVGKLLCDKYNLDGLIEQFPSALPERCEDCKNFNKTRLLIPQPEVKLEPKWIPCSERLPKEEDYRECMECLDGAVWYYTSRKTMGLGYYYYSTKQWSTICDMKPDGKVVAWMPLPEPYREGEG